MFAFDKRDFQEEIFRFADIRVIHSSFIFLVIFFEINIWN